MRAPLSRRKALNGQRHRTAAQGPTGLWRHNASGKTAQVDVVPAVTSEDMDGLMALARAGGGIVLAPSYCVQVDLMQDRLVNVLPGWHLPVAEGATVQVLTLPHPLASESAQSLVRYVREALAQSPLR